MNPSDTLIATELRTLPSVLREKPSVAQPLYYDTDTKKLCYRGFMTRASYDYLRGLCVDQEYQDALLKIYVNSSKVFSRSSESRYRSLQAVLFLLGGVLVLAALWWWLVRPLI